LLEVSAPESEDEEIDMTPAAPAAPEPDAPEPSAEEEPQEEQANLMDISDAIMADAGIPASSEPEEERPEPEVEPPEGAGAMLAPDTADPPQPEDETQPEALPAPEETEAMQEPETQALPEPETQALPEQETEALPEPDTEQLPEPEVHQLPEHETTPLPVYVDSLGSEEAPRTVKMKLTLDDVKEISAQTVEGFKHELELVPHYLFEYLCIFEGKDGEERKNRGIIAVNAFTGKYSAWEAEPEFTDEIDAHHVRLEPKIDEPAAKAVAMQGIIETNREHDEVIVERDHATIIEKAVHAPKEENIVLEKRGLVMVPVWCVEGSHGVMILDGTTGKIISEDYYQETRE
jgi:hypothetical protein